MDKESGMKDAFVWHEVVEPEQLELVSSIAEDVWPKTFRSILSEEQIRYMMNMMYSKPTLERELSEGVRFDVLFINGSPAGYVSFSAEPGKTAKLHKVYLLQQYHGQGIGQLMLNHAADRCRESGCVAVKLNVNKQNVRAQKAYRRNGYAVVASEKNPIGNGFFMDDFVMERKL